MNKKDKLISVDHLKWNVCGIKCGTLTVDYLNWILDHEEPAVDAVPVKRGMWTFIRLTDKDYGHKAKECSSCGSTFFDTKQWNYCPNCGADMRGEE